MTTKKTRGPNYIELIHSNPSFLEPKHPKMTPAALIWAAQPTLNTSVVSEHQNLS